MDTKHYKRVESVSVEDYLFFDLGQMVLLKENYPRLFSISLGKDSVVGDLVVGGQITREGCLSWNLGWRRERFIWEKHEEEQLVATISKVCWHVEGHDRMV